MRASQCHFAWIGRQSGVNGTQLRITQERTRIRMLAARSGIISGFIADNYTMEAERLNALSALLADLASRETELRGYL